MEAREGFWRGRGGNGGILGFWGVVVVWGWEWEGGIGLGDGNGGY